MVTWGFFSIPLRKIQHYPSDEILYYRIFTSLILTWAYIALFRINQVKTDLEYFYSLDKDGRRRIIILCLLSGVLISGNWFTYIYAVNNVNPDHLQVWVNGVQTTNVHDKMDAEGFIGIQHHGEKGKTYCFRNIRIKELK